MKTSREIHSLCFYGVASIILPTAELDQGLLTQGPNLQGMNVEGISLWL